MDIEAVTKANSEARMDAETLKGRGILVLKAQVLILENDVLIKGKQLEQVENNLRKISSILKEEADLCKKDELKSLLVLIKHFVRLLDQNDPEILQWVNMVYTIENSMYQSDPMDTKKELFEIFVRLKSISDDLLLEWAALIKNDLKQKKALLNHSIQKMPERYKQVASNPLAGFNALMDTMEAAMDTQDHYAVEAKAGLLYQLLFQLERFSEEEADTLGGTPSAAQAPPAQIEPPSTGPFDPKEETLSELKNKLKELRASIGKVPSISPSATINISNTASVPTVSSPAPSPPPSPSPSPPPVPAATAQSTPEVPAPESPAASPKPAPPLTTAPSQVFPSPSEPTAVQETPPSIAAEPSTPPSPASPAPTPDPSSDIINKIRVERAKSLLQTFEEDILFMGDNGADVSALMDIIRSIRDVLDSTDLQGLMPQLDGIARDINVKKGEISLSRIRGDISRFSLVLNEKKQSGKDVQEFEVELDELLRRSQTLDPGKFKTVQQFSNLVRNRLDEFNKRLEEGNGPQPVNQGMDSSVQTGADPEIDQLRHRRARQMIDDASEAVNELKELGIDVMVFNHMKGDIEGLLAEGNFDAVNERTEELLNEVKEKKGMYFMKKADDAIREFNIGLSGLEDRGVDVSTYLDKTRDIGEMGLDIEPHESVKAKKYCENVCSKIEEMRKQLQGNY